MSGRWKFSETFLNYLNQRESEGKKIESFLVFNSSKDMNSFLAEYGVKHDSKSEKVTDQEYSKIVYKGKESQIVHIFSIIPTIFTRSLLDFLVIVENEKRVSLIDGNFRAFLSIDKVKSILGTPIIQDSFYRPAGRGIKVAIIDSGIDDRHPDLTKRVINRYNLTNEEELDACGHGTMMAGIVCGTGFLSKIKFRGIAPATKLIDVKIVDKTGIAYAHNILLGLDKINSGEIEDNIDIILFGLNIPRVSDEANVISRACNKLARTKILISPAGNFGPDPMMIGPPASASGVFCVGSIDDNKKESFFSSRGPSFDGRIKPDLILPGTQIITTRGLTSELGTIYEFNESYCKISGTSVSAAIFVGIVALLLEIRPDLTSYMLRRALKSSNNTFTQNKYNQKYGTPDLLSFFKSLEAYIPKPMSYTALIEKSIVFSFSALVLILISFYVVKFLFQVL